MPELVVILGRSPLTQGRGLKRLVESGRPADGPSPLTQGRGLKPVRL